MWGSGDMRLGGITTDTWPSANYWQACQAPGWEWDPAEEKEKLNPVTEKTIFNELKRHELQNKEVNINRAWVSVS